MEGDAAGRQVKRLWRAAGNGIQRIDGFYEVELVTIGGRQPLAILPGWVAEGSPIEESMLAWCIVMLILERRGWIGTLRRVQALVSGVPALCLGQREGEDWDDEEVVEALWVAAGGAITREDDSRKMDIVIPEEGAPVAIIPACDNRRCRECRLAWCIIAMLIHRWGDDGALTRVAYLTQGLRV